MSVYDSDSDSDSFHTVETEVIDDGNYDDVFNSDDETVENMVGTERIYFYEINFIDSEKENDKYYLGLPCLTPDSFILNTAISVSSFFRFSYKNVLQYLKEYSIFRNKRFDARQTLDMEVMQLSLTNENVYRVVLKTFWIRLIQRTWKRIYQERCAVVKKRKSVVAQLYRQVHGKYPIGLNYLPSIHGMLT